MFVHAAGSCALGSDVVCDMPLPSGMCQVKGRVTRVQRMPDATGMAIQFVDLPAQQAAMLNDLVERSREPSIPLAVRFEGMPAPIQCRGVFFDDKLRLRTKVPFLRLGSNVQVSLDANHVDGPVSADLTGTLSSLALKASPIDGVPRLAIDLDVVRTESDGPEGLGPTPLEQAIAACVAAGQSHHTPTPVPMPVQTTAPLYSVTSSPSSERVSSVSGELRPRARVVTTEIEAPPADARALLTIEAAPAEPPAAAVDSVPDPRLTASEWDETQAIPSGERRRSAPGRRAPDRGRSARMTPVPVRKRSNPLALILVGAAGLGLGVLAVRAGLSPEPAATSSRAAEAPAATAIHPTVVPLPAPAPGGAASASEPAASATATTAEPRPERKAPPARKVAPVNNVLATALAEKANSARAERAVAGPARRPTVAIVTPAESAAPTPAEAPAAASAETPDPTAAPSPETPADPAPTAAAAPAPAAKKPARRARPAPQFTADPDTRQFQLAGASGLDLGGARLTGLTGLTGAAGANFRGINVPVTATATVLNVRFLTSEAGGSYAVQVTPSWPTAFAISGKTADGFTITFAVPAPESATFDWLLIH